MIISVQGVCNPLRFGHRFTRYLAFAQQGVLTQPVVVQASGVHRHRTSDTTYGSSGVKGFSSSTINMKRSDSMENLLKSVTVSRLMKPDDANIAGNVHGGVILKLIEEAGFIISTKYCNAMMRKDETVVDEDSEMRVTQLARVERTDFMQPMHIGEVSELIAEITYTSKHSLEVQVTVWAEDIIKGVKRFTNKSRLWFVPCSTKDAKKIMPVPAMPYRDEFAEEEGRKRYEKQKLERQSAKENGFSRIVITVDRNATEPHTVPYSQSTLIHLIGPDDCNSFGFSNGGNIMKLMDECAGIVAARHCCTSIVTASMDATNFHHKVKKGDLLTLTGQATFTSNRSMEIEVFVDVETWGGHEPTRAVDALFTYISLGKDRRSVPIPPLKMTSPDEEARFEAGKARYEARKRQRQLSARKFKEVTSS